VQEELQEMMIGRSDERVNPGRATAGRGRLIVVVSFAEPIWASGHDAASKAEHMTAVAPPIKSSSRPLHPRGRPHMRVEASIIARWYTYGVALVAAAFHPSSRYGICVRVARLLGSFCLHVRIARPHPVVPAAPSPKPAQQPYYV